MILEPWIAGLSYPMNKRPDVKPALRHFAHATFIVPAAHVRVFDGDFQTVIYEAFHTCAISRWGHTLCTPIINLAFFALAGTWTFGIDVSGTAVALNGSYCAAALALVFYLTIYGRRALCVAPLLALASVAAILLNNLLDEQLVPVMVSIIVAATYLQTLSHLAEPIPPPWSGQYEFRSFRDFYDHAPASRLALLAVLSVTVFPILELWAALRIWPLQVAQFLGHLGFMRDRTRRIRERVHEIQMDTRRGWSQPALKFDPGASRRHRDSIPPE